jgi:hypothetical protein
MGPAFLDDSLASFTYGTSGKSGDILLKKTM